MELNNKKTKSIFRIGPLDISILKNLVNNLNEVDWDTNEEFEVNYNKQRNDDSKLKALHFTKHIIFRFVDKRITPFQYIECSRWKEWSTTLLPILNIATDYLGYKNRYFPKVMLANLPAKNFIPPHTDGDQSGYIPHKIHIPIQTNQESFFFLESEKFHFEEGVAYEVNNGKQHGVVNNGNSDRIHLIFECLDFDLQTKTIQEQIEKRRIK